MRRTKRFAICVAIVACLTGCSGPEQSPPNSPEAQEVPGTAAEKQEAQAALDPEGSVDESSTEEAPEFPIMASVNTQYVTETSPLALNVTAAPNTEWALQSADLVLFTGKGGGTFPVAIPGGYYHPLSLHTDAQPPILLGNVTVRGTLPSFAAERDPELHVGPGSAMDPGCTTNFLFTVDNLRFFLGAAGHCFANTGGAALDGDLCDTDSQYRPIGYEVAIQGAEKPGKLAYGSYYQLRENVNVSKVWQDHPEECFHNDFALVELDYVDFDNMHPAVPLHGGPTQLGPILDPASRAAVYAYGATYLRLNTPNQGAPVVPNEADTFQGVHESYADGTGDWVINTRITPIQVFGDSGMPFLGPNGEAVGNLRGQGIAFGPGAAVYTNMPMAVEYAQQAFDSRLELVTWADFHPIVDLS